MSKKQRFNKKCTSNLFNVSSYFSPALPEYISNKETVRKTRGSSKNEVRLKVKHEEIYSDLKRRKYEFSEEQSPSTTSVKSPLKKFMDNETPKENTKISYLSSKKDSQSANLKNALDTEFDAEDELSEDNKHTPLMKQYLEFQKKYPDAFIMLECGNKYKIFGENAEIASKVLNIGLYQYHNFSSATILSQNLYYYLRYLVLHGYKVAVIKQTNMEIPGENGLLFRELHAMYTKSTFIGKELVLPGYENIDVTNLDASDVELNFLLCIHESEISKQANIIEFMILAVQVISSDIFCASFQDTLIRSQLENYLLYLKPSEILLPAGISSKTEICIKNLFSNRSTRIEVLDRDLFDHPFAMTSMSEFITESQKDNTTDEMQENLQALLSLNPSVVSCLSALKNYLTDFKLERIVKNVKNIKPLLIDKHMQLSASTIRGLELLDDKLSGSNSTTLFGAINQTSTKYGERMLKSWMMQPLKDYQDIEDRLDIVTEIIFSGSLVFTTISKVLSTSPDLERLLCSAFYKKCSCNEFLKLIQALETIRKQMLSVSDLIETEIKHSILRKALLYIVKHLDGIEKFLSNINQKNANLGNKIDVFYDVTMYPNLLQCKSEIFALEKKLQDLQSSFCKIFEKAGIGYTTINGQKFLIEVPNSLLSKVPNDWLKFSVTKEVSRFRSPEVINLCRKLDQEHKKLENAANEAWNLFLDEFESKFYEYKKVVCCLAELDCYFSFVNLSKGGNYCRPVIKNKTREFTIVEGYHPVTAKLLGDGNQFVCNGIEMNETQRCLIVTGPNMGGKSTYVRQVAVIALMAHMGCYVPATSAIVPLLDGIYIRMGADDDILNNRSTFLSEMSEASSILSSISSNSLVIMDELGRGTSTYDGAAIAYATLEYLINEVKCMTLFITHYPEVVELKEIYPENIIPIKMGYILKDTDSNDEIEYVTFLYSVEPGVCSKGYGINVAALAGISKDLLCEAAKKSKEMELKLKIRRLLQKLLPTS